MRDDGGRAGVVDDDVEPAVVPDGGVDEALGLRGVRDVGLHVDGVGELVGDLLAFGATDDAELTTTLAPRSAKAAATAAPMPLDEPVTRATRPFRSVRSFMAP